MLDETISTEYELGEYETPTDPPLRLSYRRGTYDHGTLRENYEWRSYLCHIRPRPTDVWLEGGGHIGSFASSIARHVTAVYSYEPYPGSYELLQRNISQNAPALDNIYAVRSALVPCNKEPGSTLLYVNPRGGSHGIHSLLPLRGRRGLEVWGTPISDAIETSGANCLKLDVEGAEYDLLASLPDHLLKALDELVFEYHFAYLHDDRATLMLALTAKLLLNFPVVSCIVPGDPHVQLPSSGRQGAATNPTIPDELPKTCIIYAGRRFGPEAGTCIGNTIPSRMSSKFAPPVQTTKSNTPPATSHGISPRVIGRQTVSGPTQGIPVRPAVRIRMPGRG